MIFVEKIAVTGADATRIDFTGLNGDVDGIYHVEFYFKFALGGTIDLQINDDIANARVRRHTVLSSGANANTLLVSGTADTPDETQGRVVLNAPVSLSGIAKTRRPRAETFWKDDSTGITWARLYVSEWDNLVDNVIKLSFVHSQALGIAEGSWATLYKYPVT